ncbi:phage tail assembly protein [Xanthobacter sp. VTT E-85241]|uniref:phage tail assembly protein n=1 Tax=Roseixanthobacter finlandensis TaxID=3119922 RepID=UPI00372AED18
MMAFEQFEGFNGGQGPAASAAPVPEPPVFENPSARSETVPLEWPVVFEGVRYAAISVRRLTVGEVDAYVALAREAGEKPPRFPMFDVPDAVLNHLDDDDAERVNAVMLRFLPRRFRVGTGSGQSPDGGAITPSI